MMLTSSPLPSWGLWIGLSEMIRTRGGSLLGILELWRRSVVQRLETARAEARAGTRKSSAA
jgi:hypothetical protein